MKNKIKIMLSIFMIALLLGITGDISKRVYAETNEENITSETYDLSKISEYANKKIMVSNEEFDRLQQNPKEMSLDIEYITKVNSTDSRLDNYIPLNGKTVVKNPRVQLTLGVKRTGWSGKWEIGNIFGYDYFQYSLNGGLAFCVEPGVMAGSGNFTTNQPTSIRQGILIREWALHTEKYMSETSNQTKKYERYFAGKFNIQMLASNNSSWNSSTHKTEISNEMKVIRARVAEHQRLTTFSNMTFEIKEGTSKVITDTSGQLAKYMKVANEVSFEAYTGLQMTISGNNITVTNPIGNKNNNTGEVIINKYAGWFTKGATIIYKSNTVQDMVVAKEEDPVVDKVAFKSIPIVPGSIEITKWMDGNAIYGSAVKGAKPMYDTKDTVQRYYSNYTNKIVSYPTKEEFQTQDLYSKPIVYDAIKDEPVMKTVDKLDENGEKIPVLDQEGNPELDQQGNTIYETETIQDTLSDGTPVYHALQDDQGNYIYEKITSNKIYPTLIEMENDYPAGADVKFGLYDVTKSKLLEEQGASEGLIRYLNLTPNTYWVKETATQNGFVISTEWYQVVVNEGQVTKVKNGNKIWNYQEQANFYLKKTDELGNPIENIPYIFYKKLNGSCDMSKAIATKYTDSKGEIFVSGLPGNYCYQEGNSKYGYLIDPIVYEFTAKNNETVEHTRVNKYLNIKLQLLKLNQDKLPLKDAKFNVSFADTVFMTDEEGKIVLDENGNKTVLEENLTDITTGVTNENGILELDFNMDTKYYNDSNGRPRLIKLHEIEAPTGYQLLQAPIYGYIIYVDGEFKFVSEIDDSYVIPTHILENEVTDTVANVEIENKLITNKITISKVDITNNKELPGAKICINRMSDDAVVECWISSEVQRETEITAYLDNNMCGEFYAVEEMAPEGYYRTTIVFPFKVCEQGVEQKFVIENTPIPIPLPQTGLNILVNIELILAALIVSTVTHVIIRKKVN